jgi:hypothetical protein
MKLCERCNRPLKSEKSMDDGMGRTCKKKQAVEDAEFEKIQVTIDDVIDQKEAV